MICFRTKDVLISYGQNIQSKTKKNFGIQKRVDGARNYLDYS